jgi:uncharacterized protein
MIIGRHNQIERLEEALKNDTSSFIAVTGRRRIGKTFLIDTVFEKQICFRITGIQGVDMKAQVNNFHAKLEEWDGKLDYKITTWQEAFLHLKKYLKKLDKHQKQVIFIDELPWVHTQKSGFLQYLAHFWNDYLSKEKHFILVVCGSSTSWITKKILNDKGGLHNRLTDIIHLRPFTLQETKLFFESKNFAYSYQTIAEYYMILGGIPYYLQQVRRGESPSVAIERLCFRKDGLLYGEYNNLYKALFQQYESHESIVETLAQTKYGISRNEIIKNTRIKAGGEYTRAMEDLILSGFVTVSPTFGHIKRESVYCLVDEFSVFYHQFMKNNKNYKAGIWNQISASQNYKIWKGFAFEALCKKHIHSIKKSIGISGIYTEESAFIERGTDESKGYQIDLLIDRKDACINLCEIKYYGGQFEITKSYALDLLNKKQAFIEKTKTKKQVFLTIISSYGVKENAYAKEIIDIALTLEQLFEA